MIPKMCDCGHQMYRVPRGREFETPGWYCRRCGAHQPLGDEDEREETPEPKRSAAPPLSYAAAG
jgi:hypothetical protein